MGMLEIISIGKLLSKNNLLIPKYQRPYEWSSENVKDLLNDIEDAYKNYSKDHDINYRIGAIILFKNNKGKYEIVDGQQRIITLILVYTCLNITLDSNLLNFEFSNINSIKNIENNIQIIKYWISHKKDLWLLIKKDIKKFLEVLVVTVDTLDEAFQMFDSQNSSGKEPGPHDLLKAFHLREMQENLEKREGKNISNLLNARVEKWESIDSYKIKYLFSNYLYPIQNWINGENYKKFESKDYKKFMGVTNELLLKKYNYTDVVRNHFELGTLYKSGEDFFEMVNTYIHRFKTINKELKNNDPIIYTLVGQFLSDEIFLEKENFENLLDNESNIIINDIINNYYVVGMKYTCRLFYQVLLYYYDRFKKYDSFIVNTLFKWAFSLRLDLEMVGLSSINKYALGLYDGSTSHITYNIPMFNKIKNSIYHEDLYNLNILIKDYDLNNKEDNRYKVYELLVLMYKGGD